MKKICGKCGDEKAIEAFHRDVSRKDGRHPYCAICQTAKASSWCKANRSRARVNVRRYKRSHAVEIAERGKRYRERNPEKVFAHAEANKALKRGVIRKAAKCSRCRRDRRLQMHHPDYRKPLSVVWLCSFCHSAEHRGLSRSPAMFRSKPKRTAIATSLQDGAVASAFRGTMNAMIASNAREWAGDRLVRVDEIDIVPESVGARRLMTIGAKEIRVQLAFSATTSFALGFADVVAVRIDPEGAIDEEIEAFAEKVRGLGIAVRILPRRAAASLPDSVVERAARKTIREVVAELAAGSNILEVDRPLLVEILEAKLTEAGL